MLRFTCPKCGNKMKIDDDDAGGKVRCDGCNKMVPVLEWKNLGPRNYYPLGLTVAGIIWLTLGVMVVVGRLMLLILPDHHQPDEPRSSLIGVQLVAAFGVGLLWGSYTCFSGFRAIWGLLPDVSFQFKNSYAFGSANLLIGYLEHAQGYFAVGIINAAAGLAFIAAGIISQLCEDSYNAWLASPMRRRQSPTSLAQNLSLSIGIPFFLASMVVVIVVTNNRPPPPTTPPPAEDVAQLKKPTEPTKPNPPAPSPPKPAPVDPNRPEANEGPPPKEWKVLFHSDNPALWNTDTPGKEFFALPVRKAHSKIGYLRLKRMDTKEMLILPITHSQLVQSGNQSVAGYGWNGTADRKFNAGHLGITQVSRDSGLPGFEVAVLQIGNIHSPGSGFGHAVGAKDKQYYCWLGKEIPKTSFEIAVTTNPLTEAEKLRLLPNLRRPLGTPVAGAAPQPEPPPPTAAGKMVDLMPLIDATQDPVQGLWLVVDKKALHCNESNGVPRLQIPYQPPDEYHFIVTFSQPKLRNGVALILPNPRGGSFYFQLGQDEGKSFELSAKTPLRGDLPKELEPGKACTAVVQVQRDAVTILVDGETVLTHKTNFSDLICDAAHRIDNTKLLAVACDDPTVFHYIRVVEISGPGKKNR